MKTTSKAALGKGRLTASPQTIAASRRRRASLGQPPPGNPAHPPRKIHADGHPRRTGRTGQGQQGLPGAGTDLQHSFARPHVEHAQTELSVLPLRRAGEQVVPTAQPVVVCSRLCPGNHQFGLYSNSRFRVKDGGKVKRWTLQRVSTSNARMIPVGGRRMSPAIRRTAPSGMRCKVANRITQRMELVVRRFPTCARVCCGNLCAIIGQHRHTVSPVRAKDRDLTTPGNCQE